MKLAATRDVFAYWESRRGTRSAPDRDDIDPGAIRHALGDVFVLDIDSGFGHPFRLAGTRVCAAFGRELKGVSFLSLWADVAPVRDLVKTLADDTGGVVARVTGRNVEERIVGLEMLLLPLGHRGRMPGRFLGSLAPTDMPWWLNAKPLTGLRLETLRFMGGADDIFEAPQVTAGASRSPQRPTLVVYEGGRAR
jgi:hypothetical protein